jgi:hypothetical protein
MMNKARPKPPSLFGAIDNKCPLTNDLQLATLPPQYRATTPPKYYGDSDPHKFLICYEATITSSRGDEATLAKSFIISLEGTIANWYVRLQPRSIHSWHHLREKFLVYFQGVEKESLPNFCRRFLRRRHKL